MYVQIGGNILKWKLNNKIIDNKISDLAENVVMVSKEDIWLLQKHNIPYFTFSDESKKCLFIRDGKGKKKKRFNDLQVQEIKKLYSEGLSYRVLANKFNCSTRTIYLILKDLY